MSKLFAIKKIYVQMYISLNCSNLIFPGIVTSLKMSVQTKKITPSQSILFDYIQICGGVFNLPTIKLQTNSKPSY